MFCTIHRQSFCAKMFSRLDLNQEGEALTNSLESRPWGKYTRFECSFKPVPIPRGWSILTKQRGPNWSPYDFT